jgi:putative acetyltransferase
MSGPVPSKRQEECLCREAGADDVFTVRQLFTEYRGELGDDYAIGGCGLNEEILALPGVYAQPGNFILLAYDSFGNAMGCLALTQFDKEIGEVKRMYVNPAYRGRGVGQSLMSMLVAKARAQGYKKLYLDSLHRFKAAHAIYFSQGFALCEPYDPNTSEAMKQNMHFMEKSL